MVKAFLMFPGQGAQRVGMGADLAERYPAARAFFESVDDALDAPLSRLMFEGPDDELTQTLNAQPAILAHSLAVYELIQGCLEPAGGAGHSLGEFGAYTAAGSLAPLDAIRLVRRRGELMYAAGQARPGTMAVVLGLESDDVEAACVEASSKESQAVAANVNAPDQTVISGDPEAVERAGAVCVKLGAKRVLPLNVSGAFHSPLMEPARDAFAEALNEVALDDPRFPVVANAKAQSVRDRTTARELLIAQLTEPVRWVGCMHEAASLAGDDAMFVEIGPGKVLTGLLRRILPDAQRETVSTADDVEAFMEKTTCRST
jgi:[acyl-carrier-protein] S-malonyltransferase